MPIMASVSDVRLTYDKSTLTNKFEREDISNKRCFVRTLMGLDDNEEELLMTLGNVDMYPAHMDDETAENFPMSLVFTSEFDYNRRDCEDLAKKLHKNGRLLDYCCHKGGVHIFYMEMSHPKAEQFWMDQNYCISKYL